MEKNDDDGVIRFHLTSQPYGELSNYWVLETPITHQGRTYATAEHLYQSLKYTPPWATEASVAFAERIRTAPTPCDASLMGRGFTGGRDERQQEIASIVREYKQRGAVLRKDWFSMRLQCMQLVLWLKFSRDAHCRAVLLGTGESKLIEHTKTDKFWGDGLRGDGANWLGTMLMRTRERLQHSPPVAFIYNPAIEIDPETYQRYAT